MIWLYFVKFMGHPQIECWKGSNTSMRCLVYSWMKRNDTYINGVDDVMEDALVSKSGFQKGSLPMKYLGVSLSPRKWNKIDCQIVIDKITKRMTHWSSRFLTYAGRITLINAVMFSLQVYCASIFILPKAVTAQIQQMCRKWFSVARDLWSEENPLSSMGWHL